MPAESPSLLSSGTPHTYPRTTIPTRLVRHSCGKRGTAVGAELCPPSKTFAIVRRRDPRRDDGSAPPPSSRSYASDLSPSQLERLREIEDEGEPLSLAEELADMADRGEPLRGEVGEEKIDKLKKSEVHIAELQKMRCRNSSRRPARKTSQKSPA